MNARLKIGLAVAAVAFATQASAQAVFYEQDNFQGRSFIAEQEIDNFRRNGFNNRAASVEVLGQRWEVCEDRRFSGRCVVLRPGRYPSLSAMSLNNRVSSVRPVPRNARIDNWRYAPVPVVVPVVAQITFYEREDFRGRSFTTDQPVLNFERYGFNDRAWSVEVVGERWEICEDPRFNGRCAVLRPGRYPSLSAIGLNDGVASARDMSGNGPPPGADYRRRANERLYQAQVTSVRAVVGPPEQRCWVEREQVAPEQRSSNVPGAIAGAIIGGILGHQVGGGSGKDIATVGGAVAGAAVGAQVGRTGRAQPAATQDVQRCENVPSQARPEFWDVSYHFRGQEYRVQLTAPPGATVTVNAQGEPRN